MTEQSQNWFIYIVKCADGTYYTGITTDTKRRIEEHNTSLRGAKYTRARRPVRLLYTAVYPNRSAAFVEERRIKQLSQAEKKMLCRKG